MVVADAGPDEVDVGQVADDQVAERDVLLDDRRTRPSVSVPGLRRMPSGMPILPTSWRRPATLDRRDELRVEPEPLGEEDAVAGDVLGVALRVAVLACRREDQALEDVERARLRAVGSIAAPATRIASPPLALASWSVTRGRGRSVA